MKLRHLVSGDHSLTMSGNQLFPSNGHYASSNSHSEEFYFQWHITDRCNLRCAHCYQDDYSRASELNLEELEAVGKKINYTLDRWDRDGRVAVTGGEPFMRKDLFAFLDFLEEQPHIKKIGILSNGTLIKDVSFLRKLENPRLLDITFITFRHWFGTMEYRRTKDILHVQRLLGHKSIQNTLIYIDLESKLFTSQNDGFTVRVAHDVGEAATLIEAGFEYVTGEYSDGGKLFKRRK